MVARPVALRVVLNLRPDALSRTAFDLNPTNVTNLFAQKFIARTDAKAVQNSNGVWHLHTVDGKRESARVGWDRASLMAHIEGRQTFGHYLLNEKDECKLFAFDIDLKKDGFLPSMSIEEAGENGGTAWENSFGPVEDLRSAWLNRAHPARDFMKLQFKDVAHLLMKTVWEELELPCAAAYSGAKGVHVYAFTGLVQAAEAREGAQIVLDTIGEFEPTKGNNFFEHKHKDMVNGYPNLSIEVFPKQGSLDGKDLGNLMRLPLGRNRKAPENEPAFFLDMLKPHGSFVPLDPEVALTATNPWENH